MFFSISRNPKDNFPVHYALGNLIVSTDSGWKVYETPHFFCVFKGYIDNAALETELPGIIDQDIPQHTGNFCVIVHNKQTAQTAIKTDLYRSFPIYVDEGRLVTNLEPGEEKIWTDSVISITDALDIQEMKFDAIGKIDISPIDRERALSAIRSILQNKIEKWLQHNKLPIKVFLSGGVDSLLVYSFLQRFTDEYEFVKCAHVEYDKFWLKNSGTLIKHHWAYRQIHHWTEPCVLTSGAPGDEFMMRSPTTIDLFLKYHGMSVPDLLKHDPWSQSLHAPYFAQPKHQTIFCKPAEDKSHLSIEQFYWSLCNIVINDWQHWHLGNTLTWTPLRDLEIFKILLRLPTVELLPQIFDSELSRDLIEKNQPGLTALISDKKNTDNYMSNLSDFYFQHSV
jgi:hypothetical protein